MSNLDLTIAEIMHGDTQVLRIMRGDIKKWPSWNEYIVYGSIEHISSTVTLPTRVTPNSSFTTTLSVNDGYELSSITIMMGNEDITNTAISNGVITITEVTGDVYISASTVAVPYDREVEYLQTDGNAFINLTTRYPVTSSSVTVWSGKIGYRNGSTGRRFLAAYGHASYAHYCEINANDYFGFNNLLQIQSNTMYEVEMTINGNQNNTQKIKDLSDVEHSVVYTSYQGTDSMAFSLFRLNTSYRGSGQRIGRNKFIYNGTTIFDFIPVRKNGNGYMYNKKNGTLYGNANSSGAFTYGNDV